ncbi:MAG TPA: pyrroloquinoline quinone biosynthesis protein PqqB [Alphaproteobacteria bacterium]|nr:pyrroloquinoline quinone biosynthesis protein PqqB [Alphaproteobacteria bacterium]
MLHVVVLGAAAGGGFPQWNSNDVTARRARAGDPKATPQTQSSIAVSADGTRWAVLNASPDLRQQIFDRHQLHPAADAPLRASPIAAVVATNADVDHVAGLLNLRESQPFVLYAHPRVLGVLAKNSIFNVLNAAYVSRRALPLEQTVALSDQAGADLGITVKAFVVPGKIALWLEDPTLPDFGSGPGDTIGLEISTPGSPSFFYIPGVSEFPVDLAQRLRSAAMVFFDGTLWRDDEMILAGVGVKTGQRMGHMSCSGPNGTIAAFADLGVKRKIFIHINNTNPLLVADSPERAEAARAGWEVAFDGMEINL